MHLKFMHDLLDETPGFEYTSSMNVLRFRRPMAVALVGFLAVAGVSAGALAATSQPEPPPSPAAYAPGELIIKLKPDASLADLAALNARFGVMVSEPVFPKTTDPNDHLAALRRKLATLTPKHQGWSWYADKESQEAKDYAARIAKEREELQQQIQAEEELIARLERRQQRAPAGVEAPALETTYLLKAPAAADVAQMAEAYAQHPAVEYAEPNYTVTIQMVPNDPYYQDGRLWGIKQIHAEQAWDHTLGDGAIVAVVDTGVDYTHPDLARNIWTNGGEIPGNGVDDDGNGYVDDVRGYDFVNRDADPKDDAGHGTHVAGTVAAAGMNGIGVVGVAPDAQILMVKALNHQGVGTSSTAAAAMVYAIKHGADVVNCSFVSRDWPRPFKDAVLLAASRGVAIVAGAGNDGWIADIRAAALASEPSVILVAATTPNDAKADFSNYGATVDLAAPGVGIWSTVPGTGFPGGSYAAWAGTSMATPHVSGAMALLIAKDLTAPLTEVRRRLLATADPFPVPPDHPIGRGRLNVGAAMTSPRHPDLAVTRVQVTDVDGDGFPRAGDMLQITVTLKNLWADAKAVSAMLSPAAGSPVTVVKDTITFGPIAIDQERGNAGTPFVFRVGALDPLHAETPMPMTLTTTADGVTQQFPVAVSLGLRQIATTADGGPMGFSESPVSLSGTVAVWADQRHAMDADGYPTKNYDIYVVDLAQGAERRVTTDPALQAFPAVGGRKLIWYDDRGNNRMTWLYSYDLATGGPERQLVQHGGRGIDSFTYFGRSIGVSETAVVWQTLVVGRWDIRAYRWDRQAVESLTDDAAVQRTPAIDGTRVVWADERHAPPGQPYADIYWDDLADSAVAQRLTTVPAERANPAISGSRVVWQDKRHGQWEIYLYDLATQKEQRITTNAGDQITPAIAGTRVAWVDVAGAPMSGHVVLYDLATQQGTRLTQLPGNTQPAISPAAVVWRRGQEILAAKIAADPSVTILSPKGGERVEAGRPLTIRWRFEDDWLPPGAEAQTLLNLKWGDGVVRTIDHGALMSKVGENAFTWTVPADFRPGAGYKIFVQIEGSSKTKLTEATSNPFEILPPFKPPTIVVTAPPAGTRATAGQPLTVRWRYDAGGAIRANATVALQRFEGGVYREVARLTTGAKLWAGETSLSSVIPATVPPGPTHRVVVQVSYQRPDGGWSIIYDDSDGFLEIVAPPNSANQPPQILYAGAFRWWGYLYAYTFARDPEDGYIYNWGQYRWSVNGAAYPGWYLFQRFGAQGPMQATVTVTDRHGASVQRSVVAR